MQILFANRIIKWHPILNFCLNSLSLLKKDGGFCKEESYFYYGLYWQIRMEEIIQLDYYEICH